MNRLPADIRHAFRALLRRPVFTATIVLTLALGIGANATIFSALDAVLLRPLPYPQPEQLVRLTESNPRSSDTQVPPARLEDWRRLTSTFAAITGWYPEDVSETSGDLPERVRRATVTPGFLDVWGIMPARGRAFSAEEHRWGGPSSVIISDRYWRRRFGADPDILSRTVRFGTTDVPVIGVMPADFLFADRDVDMWVPMPVDAPFAQTRTSPWYQVAARLQNGATMNRARADLEAVQSQLAGLYPESDRDISVHVEPLKESTVGSVGSSLWLLFGAVSVLLLVACTNIAALLLARATHRREELAVRRSLGASRTAIASQLLTEAGVLATMGALLALPVAIGASRILRNAGAGLPRFDEVAVDGRVLLYTLVATVVVTLVCGLLPAVRAAGGIDALRGGRTQVSGRNRLQWLLVGAQVALSVALLGGAGLLVRSFHELSKVEPGFDTRNVLAFRMSGSWSETSDFDALQRRVERTIDALATLPGVENAAATGWVLPGVPEQWQTTFQIAETADDAQPILAEGRAVSPEYFATMRIPLLAGQPCRRQAEGGAYEAMVNRAFVTRYVTDRDAVGLHLQDPTRPPVRIVGVVGDAREQGLDRDPGPTVYWCLSAPNPMPWFIVRTRGDLESMAQSIRVELKELEPLRAVYDFAPVEERIGDAFAESRLRTVLLTLFAGSALGLACLGLYGTLSYIVGQRRREVGLRLALGSMRRGIVSLFLTRSLAVVAGACVLGIAIALAGGRFLAGMLYGIAPTDPFTLAGVVLLVMLVAALAVALPALRAARLDPARVLRD